MKARPLTGRLHDAHHGVRRHRLELRGLRADLALIEAAGGQGEVEELDGPVVRASEADLSSWDWEGSCRRNLPGHPPVELHVVLVPLDAVERLAGQVIVAPQLYGLVNLGRSTVGAVNVVCDVSASISYLGMGRDADISQENIWPGQVNVEDAEDQ